MIEIEKIVQFYRRRVDSSKASYDILDWGSSEEQHIRFQVLIDQLKKIDITEPFSVLDVGCGLCDLHDVLDKHFDVFDYQGVDLTSEIVDEAARRKPGINVVNADIFGCSPFADRSFDIVFSSGVFNLDVGNNLEWVKSAMSSMFALCRKGCMINFLHQRAIDKYEQCFYYDPNEIVEYARAVAPHVEIIDDYLDKDFTIWMS